MSSHRREERKQVVKEMRICLNKLKITRDPKYLLDILEAAIVLEELRLHKSSHRRNRDGK